MTSAKIVVTLCGATASENALGCLAASSKMLAAGVSPMEAAKAFTVVEQAGLDGRIQEIDPEQRRLAVTWINAQRAAYSKIMESRGQAADGPLPDGFDMRLVYQDTDGILQEQRENRADARPS